jgi:hypothetical protein
MDEPVVLESYRTFTAIKVGGALFEEDPTQIGITLMAVTGAHGYLTITVPRATWQERYALGRRFTLEPAAANEGDA